MDVQIIAVAHTAPCNSAARCDTTLSMCAGNV